MKVACLIVYCLNKLNQNYLAKEEIPFFIELNPLNFTPFSQRTNNHLKIPVNIENGPVVIPNLTNGKIIVLESIAIAKNGICTIPIPEIKTTEIHWKQPVDVQPLVNVNVEKPNVPKTNINISQVIRTSHLNPEEKDFVHNLKIYIFYNENSNLSFTNAVKHKIRTTDEEPIYCKSYRYPHHLKVEIQSQIQKLLDNEIIRPSISPYSSPV
jgi:hypothetical protein